MFDEANGQSSSWDAWASAIIKMQHTRGGCHSNAQIRYVAQRGMCLRLVTYGIEQSFSRIAGVLGIRRPHASVESEQRSVRLLVSNLTPLEVARLGAEASKVWSSVFPERHALTHKRKRIDKGMHRRQPAPPQQAPRQQPTDKPFLKRLRAQVRSRVAS